MKNRVEFFPLIRLKEQVKDRKETPPIQMVMMKNIILSFGSLFEVAFYTRRSNRHSSHRHRDYEEDETESSRHRSHSRRDQRNQDHWNDVSKNTLDGDWDAATPLQSICLTCCVRDYH